MLKIEELHASIEDKEILRGVNLQLKPGEVHAIMGPNGSGKSTLASVLIGREGYQVSGSVAYEGQDLLTLSPEERAAAGVFLAFQHPVEIPGVGNMYFMRTALNSLRRQRGEEELDLLRLSDDRVHGEHVPDREHPEADEHLEGEEAGAVHGGVPVV